VTNNKTGATPTRQMRHKQKQDRVNNFPKELDVFPHKIKLAAQANIGKTLTSTHQYLFYTTLFKKI
jgi:hypothetical protein